MDIVKIIEYHDKIIMHTILYNAPESVCEISRKELYMIQRQLSKWWVTSYTVESDKTTTIYERY
jgi:hypothetical protein